MTTVWVLTVVAFAVMLRSIWGFGDAMVGVPLLAALIGLDQGAPLMVLLSLVMATVLLGEQPELVERWSIVRLILGALLGVPLGVYVLVGVDPVWVHRGLGVVLFGFGLISSLRRAREPDAEPVTRDAWWLDVGFGILAGASSAAFDIAGPPLLIYAGLRGWDPDRLRINLQAAFLPIALVTAGGHFFGGLWTKQILILAAASLPIVILGLILAPRLRKRFESDSGQRLVYGLIALLGLIELIRTFV